MLQKDFNATLVTALFYQLVFCIATGFPKIYEAIKIDNKLNVQMQYCGDNIPLLMEKMQS